MSTLYQHRDENLRRTWLLFGGFVVVVLALGWLFGTALETKAFVPVAVVVSVVSSLLSYWYADRFVLALAHARPVQKADDPELYRLVENLSITAGLPMPRLYLIDDPSPNAFATGRNPAHAVVAVTSGLRALLDKTELEGVLAHELSHIGNRDMLVATMAAVLAGTLIMLSRFFFRFGDAGGRRRGHRGGGGAILLAGSLIALIVAPLAAALLRLAISRQREYLADSSGALLTRFPEGLAQALEKIGASARPLRVAPEAIAHLWCSDPHALHADTKEVPWIVRIFQTHPPVSDRVQRLRSLKI